MQYAQELMRKASTDVVKASVLLLMVRWTAVLSCTRLLCWHIAGLLSCTLLYAHTQLGNTLPKAMPQTKQTNIDAVATSTPSTAVDVYKEQQPVLKVRWHTSAAVMLASRCHAWGLRSA
jgi:hypothetical protein